MRTLILILTLLAAAGLMSCAESQTQKDAKEVARKLPDESLAQTAKVEAKQTHTEVKQLRQDVEKTPDDQLPGKKAEIIARLKAIETRAEKLETYGAELERRVENDKPVLQQLQVWGVRVLAAGVVLFVIGAALLVWKGKTALMWIGAVVAAIGAALYALGIVLWWAVVLAMVAAVGVVIVLLIKRYRLWDAAVRIVHSIDEAGLIDAGAPKDVLDRVQGPRGKALVDRAKKVKRA